MEIKLNGMRYYLMRNIFLIILFVVWTPTCIKSQQIFVKDSLSGEPIPYCDIIVDNNKFISDSLGEFNFSGIALENKSFIVNVHGYHQKKVSLKRSGNIDVLLSPVFIDIRLVNITKFRNETKIGLKRGKGTLTTQKGLEITARLQNPYNTILLEKIFIPIRKIKNYEGYIILNIYEAAKEEGNGPTTKLNATPIVLPINTFRKRNVPINLKKYNIKIPQGDFFIAMKIVQKIGVYETMSNYPEISFHVGKKRDITFFRKDTDDSWAEYPVATPPINFILYVKY